MSAVNTLVADQEPPAELHTWQGACILYQPSDSFLLKPITAVALARQIHLILPRERRR